MVALPDLPVEERIGMRTCHFLVFLFLYVCFLRERSLVLEHLLSRTNHGIVEIQVLHPCVLVHDVIDNPTVDIPLQEVMTLLYHQVPPFQSAVVSIRSERIHCVLLDQLV